jgi:hypothetical protein
MYSMQALPASTFVAEVDREPVAERAPPVVHARSLNARAAANGRRGDVRRERDDLEMVSARPDVPERGFFAPHADVVALHDISSDNDDANDASVSSPPAPTAGFDMSTDAFGVDGVIAVEHAEDMTLEGEYSYSYADEDDDEVQHVFVHVCA